MNNNSSIADFVRNAQEWTQSFSQAFSTVSQDTYKKMQDLSATVKQGYELLKQDFAAFKNTKFGTALIGAASAAGTFLLDFTKKSLTSAITGAIQKEKDIVNLSGFLGKKGATEAYKNIDADSNATSYDKATLLDANKGLISVDGDAKRAREEIMNLANSVSFAGGGSNELSKLSEQLKEIKSEGMASGNQLKQFGDAGIDIYAALSSSTGKSIEQLKGMNITYDMLAKSLADAKGKGGIFEGGLDAQSNTVEAKWDRIKKTFDSTLTDLGTAFLPIISSALDVGVQLVKGFEPLMTLVKPYMDQIVGSLSTAYDFILNLGGETNAWGGFVTTIQEYFSIVWNTLGSIFGAVWSIVSGVIDWISKSVLISDIFTGVYKVLGAVLTMVGWLADGIKYIWENALRPILDAIETAYRWVRKIVGGEEVAIGPKITITTPKDLAKDLNAQQTALNFAKPGTADLTARSRPTAISQGESIRTNNAAKSRETGDTVSGGGQKTINITLGKFFDTIQFNTLNSGETSDQLESIVMECLGRVLYNGAKVM